MNMNMKKIFLAASLLLLLSVVGAFGQGTTIYSSIPSPLPGNLPSVGGEAYAFNELGDAITFTGTDRSPKAATITMSSWGCQNGHWYASVIPAPCVTTPGATFSLPITLNIYNAGSPNPGTPIATKIQTFTIPYRPSADPSCSGGRWKELSSGKCYNGFAYNITFDLSTLNVVLPNSAVYGIVYNTSHFGPSPIGESAACFSTTAGCGYDSLNVALSSAVGTGSRPFPNTLYWNNAYSANYCDGGVTGTFRLDSLTSACWYDSFPGPTFGETYIPTAKFTAYTIATSVNGCKNNGWQSLARAGGSTFKNQGDCIQYVNTGK